MAPSIPCVSCAALPTKDRGAAIKTRRCPECGANVGVTSYGQRFRMAGMPARSLLARVSMPALTIGAGACMAVFVVMAIVVAEYQPTPESNLLAAPERPPMPAVAAPEPHDDSFWANLARLPEVSLEGAPPADVNPAEAHNANRDLIAKIRMETGAKGHLQFLNGARPIRRLNPEPSEPAEKPYAFLHAQMERRPELRGLPFIMNEQCRLTVDQGLRLQDEVTSLRRHLDLMNRGMLNGEQPWSTKPLSQTGIAAATQILCVEKIDLRASLVRHLANSDHIDATRHLAKLALFDPSDDIGTAAMDALQGRPRDEYGDILMFGIRYPLPYVARRAAHAMVALDRKDLLRELARYFDEPAPGDPATTNKTRTIREVVRINHHRNCLLCHAPAESEHRAEIVALVPTPGAPMPRSSQEYYGNRHGLDSPSVSAATTHLRQDFSVMMEVKNPGAWPAMQRFDFVVRTRVVEGKELQALQRKVDGRPADFVSDNHQAALQVLQQLTGWNASANSAIWRRILDAIEN